MFVDYSMAELLDIVGDAGDPDRSQRLFTKVNYTTLTTEAEPLIGVACKGPTGESTSSTVHSM